MWTDKPNLNTNQIEIEGRTMSTFKKGTCCVCQSEVPIAFSHLPRDEEKSRGMEDWEIDMTYLDNINFICIDHDFYGQHCEGSGQIPQFINK